VFFKLKISEKDPKSAEKNFLDRTPTSSDNKLSTFKLSVVRVGRS
jgi:hypothetical protein